MTLIEKIRDLVAEGQTEKSIEELLGYVKESNNDVVDHLVLLKGRMKTLNKAIIDGTIDTEVASLERAKINESILKILNEITPSYLGLEKPVTKIVHSPSPTKQIQNRNIIVGTIAIVLAVGALFYFLTKEPPQPTPPIQQTIPKSTVTDVALVQTPIAEHNAVANNAYWMNIRLPGRIIGSRGQMGQLKTYFTYNGKLLEPSAFEVTYRDPNFNCVTVFSQSFYIDSDNYHLDNFVMSIPYSALNLPNTKGTVEHHLQFFVEVFINGNKVKISPYQSFNIKW